MKSYFIIFILIAIIFSIAIKRAFQEGFGYDNDPSQFREPKIYPNFITEDEAKYILKTAEYNYEDSIVVGSNSKGIRKSQTYWLNKEDPIAKNIIEKV
jgi:hypothetical protein